MSSKIPVNFFIVLSSFLSANVEAYEVEAVELCRYYTSVNSFDRLRQLARVIHSPIGRYYFVMAQNNWKNPSNFDISGISDRYRPRVLLSIGQSFRHTGDYTLARSFIKEAHHLASKQQDLFTLYHSQKEIAIDQSLAGNHQGALQTLEASYPIIKSFASTYPSLYFDFYNGLAVELKELGRIDEARKSIDVALASPFSKVYDYLHVTRAEVEEQSKRASQNFIFIGREAIADNVIALPQRLESQVLAIPSSEPARILSYERREPMADANQKKKPELDDEARARVDEKLGKLFRRLYHPDTELTEDMVDEMLRITEPAQPEQESK